MENWGFAKVWNDSLMRVDTRDMKPRDNLWASELGKAPIDLYLKMKGTQPSNPPNARSLRKFEAGNVFEWIVSLILKRAGILQDQQHWSAHQYEGLLNVTGKADFIAGGIPDYEKWQNELSQLELPEVFMRASLAVMEHFKIEYPNGLIEIPLEIKSTGSFMFETMEKTNKPNKNHRIQTFHYLKSENRPRANLTYICRDDLRIMEFTVLNPSFVEDEYKGHIEEISKYFYANERPPLAPLLVFDEDEGKFRKNWNVEYSNYLTMLYGFKEPDEYGRPYQAIASKFNRVMGRVKRGDKMTDKNEEVLKEIKNLGYDLDAIITKFTSDTEEELENQK